MFDTQVYGMLILVISLIVYGYVLPYKSKVANGVEIVTQLNFLTLLVLEATPLFRETLFIFPAPTGKAGIADMKSDGHECDDNATTTSSLTWLLLPFYYVPLLALVAMVIGYSILCSL